MPIVDRGRIAAALPGQVLGRELGSGAFGLVLAARQRDLHRDVAVKVIDLGAAGPSPALRAEASSAHPLTGLDHPHLSRTYAVIAVERLLLLVTELVPGGSLDRQNLSPQAACAVALGIADALTHAHAVGILHADLKPANILFTADGQPKLTDLGVAAFAEDSGLTAGRIVGTPQYLSPEQITGGPLGPPADLYALATTLYELLAGAPLFGAGRTAQDLFRHHCEVVPPPPPGVPAPVADLLGRTLAKAPADRPQTATEFALQLAEAARLGYGPGWLETAGIPLGVSAGLRELTSRPAEPSGAPADPDATLKRSPDATLAALPGQPRPPETATALLAAPPAAPGAAAPSATGRTAVAGPVTASAGAPASPAGPRASRTGRSRIWRTAVPIAVVVAVLAVAAAVVLPRALGGGETKPPAQTRASVLPAGPTAPPTVRPAAGSAALPSANPPPLPVVLVAGSGQAGFSGDTGPAATANLDHPYGPVIDAAGNLYFADFDNNRVRRISPDGTITTVAGSGQAGFGGDGGPATAAMLNKPVAVAIGPGGTLYIVDTFNMRVRQVSADGIITTVAGSGERPWNPDDDGKPATQAAMWYPSGIAVDATGDLFIADNGNDIIRRVGVDGIITTVAGRFGYGSWGDGRPATQAMISKPFNVALDRQGRIYIADSYNHRIRRIGLDGVIETIAGTGAAGYSGDGGKATAATLRDPRGVTVDAAGNVYITDTDNNRIRKVDTAGIITTIAGTSPPGSKGSAASAGFYPDGPVAVDNTGHLFVAERSQNRLARIDLTG